MNDELLKAFLEGMSRDQRMRFAELVYPEVKDSTDYAQLTQHNRDMSEAVEAINHWRQHKALLAEPVVNQVVEPDDNDTLDLNELAGGTKSGRIDCSKPNLSVLPKSAVDMDKLEQSVRLFFEGIGDDPERDGIKDTPKRVARVWAETMNGYFLKPEDYVTMFENDTGYDGPVIVKDMEFYTKCEHHLEPFHGTIDIAYWPNEKIIGLSKLLRVARVFAKRPQNQERLTTQIADALEEVLDCSGVAVRIKAEHHCMVSRGVRIKGSHTVTWAERGVKGWIGVFNE